jgi:hypothetical protein
MMQTHSATTNLVRKTKRDFALLKSGAALCVLLTCGSAFCSVAPAPAAPPPASHGTSSSLAAAPPAATAPATAPEEPSTLISVTRVVGQVDNRFITSREVRINDAVDQAFAAKAEGSRILSGTEQTFPNNVSKVLDEWVIDLEAVSFSAVPPSNSELSLAIKSVNDYWGSKLAWRELEVANEELRKMVERKLMARDFEKLRGDVALVPISDSDAQSYYQKNRLRFGTLPFSSFKDNIKTFLAKQQIESRLSEWHEVLRRMYKVRNFIAG